MRKILFILLMLSYTLGQAQSMTRQDTVETVVRSFYFDLKLLGEESEKTNFEHYRQHLYHSICLDSSIYLLFPDELGAKEGSLHEFVEQLQQTFYMGYSLQLHTKAFELELTDNLIRQRCYIEFSGLSSKDNSFVRMQDTLSLLFDERSLKIKEIIFEQDRPQKKDLFTEQVLTQKKAELQSLLDSLAMETGNYITERRIKQLLDADATFVIQRMDNTSLSYQPDMLIHRLKVAKQKMTVKAFDLRYYQDPMKDTDDKYYAIRYDKKNICLPDLGDELTQKKLEFDRNKQQENVFLFVVIKLIEE